MKGMILKLKKLIEVKNISARYNNEIILKDVNLNLYEKDFLGLIGPNGGGKTTLLKVILGIIKPFKGEIIYSEEIKDIRNSIGYLPQISNIDKKFPITVKDVITSGLYGEKKYDEEIIVEKTLERLNIHKIKNKNIGEISGGQMQRVFIARAMVSSPKVLILDEPNTFVDKSFEKDLYVILKELNKDIAIVLVTHDLGIIPQYVKNIACVNRKLHYHSSNEITNEIMKIYNCPIELIAHGEVPHRVLKKPQGDENGR